jgi:hypothetical protein
LVLLLGEVHEIWCGGGRKEGRITSNLEKVDLPLEEKDDAMVARLCSSRAEEQKRKGGRIQKERRRVRSGDVVCPVRRRI